MAAAYLIALGFLPTAYAATLEWMRTLGTSQEDVSYGIAADGLGSIYITGMTGGSWRLPVLLVGILFAQDVGLGIVADGLGNVYITGETRAILGTGSSARGDANAFIAKFRDEAVPEPGGMMLVAVGLFFVAIRRYRFM